MEVKQLRQPTIVLILIGASAICMGQTVYTLDTGLEQLTRSLVDRAQLRQRTRLAVVPLVDYRNKETRFGTYVAEELTTRLFGYQRFDLVERQLLDKAINEIKRQNPNLGITDPKTAIRLGKMLNAEAILVGSYEDLGYTRKVNARILDVALGSVVSAAGVSIERSKLPEDGSTEAGEAKGGAISELNRTIYFGGDWLTVVLNSVQLVESRYLLFSFTVRNPFDDEVTVRLDNPAEKTYIVDNFGNAGDFVSAKGLDRSQSVRVKPEQRVTFSVTVKAPSSAAGEVTLRTEWNAYGRQVHGTKRFVEKNITVPGR